MFIANALLTCCRQEDTPQTEQIGRDSSNYPQLQPNATATAIPAYGYTVTILYNHMIGSSVKISKSLELYFRIPCFFITLLPNQNKITNSNIFDRSSTQNLGVAL